MHIHFISEYLKILLGGPESIYPLIRDKILFKPFLYLMILIPLLWMILKKFQSYFRNQSTQSLLAGLFLSTGVQLLISKIHLFTLGTILLNPNANSFLTVAKTVPFNTYFTQFSKIRSQLPMHATSNMPGKALFFYLLDVLTTEPEILAAIVLFLSNLGGVFVYLISLRLAEIFPNQKLSSTPDARLGAFYAAVLYWFYPGKIFFFPLLNTLTPTLLLGNLWIFLLCLESPTWLRVLASGVSLFSLFIFEPLPFGCGLFHIFFLFYYFWTRKRSASEIMKIIFGTWASFLICDGLMWAVTGLESLSTFLTLLQVNSTYYKNTLIPMWYVSNLWNFFLGLGYATCFILVSLLLDRFRTRKMPEPRNLRFWYGLSFILTLTVLEIAGVTRAESIRLWIFLGCLIYPLLGPALAERCPPVVFRWVVTFNLIQTIFALYLIGFIWFPS